MKKPHLLLITCDELRRDALGCYGGTAVNTPHLDALAAQGARFDQAYTVSPQCMPARCSLLTGLYPHRSGAYSNHRPNVLRADTPNLFGQLRAAGYTNGLIGKCHFAPVPYKQVRADRTLPYEGFADFYRSLGIDYLALQDDKQVSVWYYDDYSTELEAHGYLKAYRDCLWNRDLQKVFPFPAPDEWHPDAWVGDKATAYLRGLDAQAPSFTWVSFSGPHYPFDTPASYAGRVDESKLPGKIIAPDELAPTSRIHHDSYYGNGRMDGCGPAPGKGCVNYTDAYWLALQKQYYANVALIDDKVGEIIAAARERFGDDLLVIFTADHGEMLGHHGLWGKRYCAYDDVWRIPFLVQGLDFEAGASSDAMISLLDILPTCVNRAGGVPAACDGQDLRRQLDTGGYAYVFAESDGLIAVTDGVRKCIHVEVEVGIYDEYFDHGIDPQERDNLLGRKECAADVARLRGALVAHMMDKVLP